MYQKLILPVQVEEPTQVFLLAALVPLHNATSANRFVETCFITRLIQVKANTWRFAQQLPQIALVNNNYRFKQIYYYCFARSKNHVVLLANVMETLIVFHFKIKTKFGLYVMIGTRLVIKKRVCA